MNRQTATVTGKRKRGFEDEGGTRSRPRPRPRQRSRPTPTRLPIPRAVKSAKSLSAASVERLSRDGVSATQRTAEWIGLDITALPRMASQTSGDNRSSRSSGIDRASSATSFTSSNSKISVYEADLARQLLEYNNYYGPGTDVRPDNEAEIRARLSQPRRSLSPSRYSDSKFRDFEQVNADCKNEDEVVSRVITPYFTDYFRSRQGYGRDTYAQNTQMKNLKPLCNKGTSEMKDLKPDFCRGVAPNDVDQELLRGNLRGSIQGKRGGPVAVNDFLDVKGPDGSNKVLEVQATQNGAAGARAMHHLRAYGLPDGTRADGIARSFSMTYNGGTLVPYVSHVHPPIDTGGEETTYTTRVGGEYMLGSPGQFRAGLTLYRNATEEAYRYRRDFVEEANARARLIRNEARQTPLSSVGRHPGHSNAIDCNRRSISDVDQHHTQGGSTAKRVQLTKDQTGSDTIPGAQSDRP